ncbi:MAG: AGE family epimerase/isomerase [candidate division KSB1 bacterium]|nr:AGE family epimerase/isomerase [candidate division KSB1 bacterium]
MESERLQELKQRAHRELLENILPFWRSQVIDYQNGGFIGRMSHDLVIDKRAPKGLILNARLLWSYSALYDFTQDSSCLNLARRAYDYLLGNFLDSEYGGAYWMLDVLGAPLDAKKKIYGQAFVIYALAEYYRVFGQEETLAKALELFELIENAAWDEEFGGYVETFERDWTPTSDLRLSAVDMNEKKSMNTHLHVLEAYAALYRQSREKAVAKRLEQVLQLFFEHIIDAQAYRLHMFFDEKWTVKSTVDSFGHDIEASWLLCEAAEILEDNDWIGKAKETAVKMADAVLEKAVDKDGGIFYEGGPEGIIDTDKHWWPQAEGAVGFLNAYSISRDERFLDAAVKTWEFIEQYIVDKVHGEWFWRVDRDGKPILEEPKVSEWKCPYHNSRACLEIIKRVDQLNQ